jgi:four helix bundle protein
MLRIYEVVLGIVKDVRPLLEAIEHKDPDLARQMRRATTSVALNTAEGMGSRGKNREVRYHSALGSMRETLSCIEVSLALGYVEGVDEALLDRIDRVLATLHRLSA